MVLVASFALVFGQECPEPVPCKDDEMSCGSTWDEATGCMNPEICVPMKGGIVKTAIISSIVCSIIGNFPKMLFSVEKLQAFKLESIRIQLNIGK